MYKRHILRFTKTHEMVIGQDCTQTKA